MQVGMACVGPHTQGMRFKIQKNSNSESNFFPHVDLFSAQNSAQQPFSGADLGGGCRGCAPLPEMTCGFNTTGILQKKCGLLVLVTPFLSGAPHS